MYILVSAIQIHINKIVTKINLIILWRIHMSFTSEYYKVNTFKNLILRQQLVLMIKRETSCRLNVELNKIKYFRNQEQDKYFVCTYIYVLSFVLCYVVVINCYLSLLALRSKVV